MGMTKPVYMMLKVSDEHVCENGETGKLLIPLAMAYCTTCGGRIMFLYTEGKPRYCPNCGEGTIDGQDSLEPKEQSWKVAADVRVQGILEDNDLLPKEGDYVDYA